jgi:hypothetical protein
MSIIISFPLHKPPSLGYSILMVKRIATLCAIAMLSAGTPLWPQALSPSPGQQDEQLSFVGLKLDDLYRRFGSPQTVYAARGGEHWQDDVVFVYNEGDFYIHRDRVWQISVKSILNMRVGDAKGVALLVFGESARDEGDYVVASLPGGTWPLSIRFNCSGGRITAIFLYCMDY